jgi:ribA/ribD-fused uncharacterized protein
MAAIKFYSASDALYGCFSNFSNHAVFINGKEYPTTEHYFQAQKFAGTEYEETVRLAKTPAEAKELGRGGSLRADWEQVKEDIMKEGLLAKFIRHKDARKSLFSTGSYNIVEHTQNDAYWGDGGNGHGKNRLGELLVQVREELKVRYEDEAKNVLMNSKPVLPERARSAKVRKQRNVYRFEDGSAIMEKNNDAHGQVSIVGSNIDIPISALPTSAKFVVHRNQYQRKWDQRRGVNSELADQDDDDNDQIDDESANYYYDRDNKKNASLADYISGSSNEESEEEQVADFLRSAGDCISSVKSNLELYNSIDKSDTNNSNDEMVGFVKEELKKQQQALLQFVDQPQEEQVMMDLLTQLEALNLVLAV